MGMEAMAEVIGEVEGATAVVIEKVMAEAIEEVTVTTIGVVVTK